MRIFHYAFLLVAVGLFLFLRQCIDRKVEKVTDKEIVREDEEILGSWASKSKEAFVMFRLRRDGTLNYSFIKYPATDTTKITGYYKVASGGNANYFPRLYTFTDKGDTIFNYYVRYITPYNSTIDKYAKLVLNANSVFDTAEYIFYRIKQ
jgi:hypothetical protein